MIKLTKISGEVIAVNSEHIRFVQSVPSTAIIFVDQQSMLVKESLDEVVKKMNELRLCGVGQAKQVGVE